MSLLGAGYTAPEPKPSRNAVFKCPACGHSESQPKTVKSVMHRCPVSKTLKEMTRG